MRRSSTQLADDRLVYYTLPLPVAATMQITADHVVLRNDVSIDVIANDHFC